MQTLAIKNNNKMELFVGKHELTVNLSNTKRQRLTLTCFGKKKKKQARKDI